MPENFNAYCEKLQESSYKITPQRQMILKTLLDNAEKHFNAEELHFVLKQTDPEIGLATVYRTLEILSDLDILHKIDFGDGSVRYEFSEHEAHNHHHLICIKCGRIIEVNDDLLEALETWIEEKTLFHITDHQLKFFGYCRNCQ
ncbi:MAG: Fur family transcriptional regulator [Syntrophaceticus sp.]|nr:Fur family transcriptional regulator [Syntrophaceticus sp.]MDD3314874.1 Fur family transcriptional regulator [Syntrophaceticus sp.]MDD4359204.1 Fur family transcriptional regulator [Syntrophaceticus sp.]MDD4782040.1 Fur family transcriptional regulator [Syntrophaceticus sp.]HBG22546.1 transcriptional repressor [Peptococcaceae bacterium]